MFKSNIKPLFGKLCLSVCVQATHLWTHVHIRRQCWISWSRSYRWLWVNIWLLGTIPGSSRRAESVWASPKPHFRIEDNVPSILQRIAVKVKYWTRTWDTALQMLLLLKKSWGEGHLRVVPEHQLSNGRGSLCVSVCFQKTSLVGNWNHFSALHRMVSV